MKRRSHAASSPSWSLKPLGIRAWSDEPRTDPPLVVDLSHEVMPEGLIQREELVQREITVSPGQGLSAPKKPLT